MKTLKTFLVLFALTLLPFVGKVGAQSHTGIQAFTNFAGLGSLQRAIDEYFVPNSQGLNVIVYQYKPDGKEMHIMSSGKFLPWIVSSAPCRA